jgi:predicted amidohydrolase YtcJ
VKTLDDLLKAIEDRAKTTPEGQWISGNQGFLFGQETQFDRWTIDQVAPKHPVYLRHSSGQYSVVNSLALQLAKVDKNTPDPKNGKIVRDAQGEPTGVLLHYPAENLVLSIADGWPNLSDQDLENDFLAGQDTLLSAGITSGQDVIVGNIRDVQVYKNLADNNKLKMRMYLLLYVDSEQEAQQYVHEVEGYKSDYLTFAGWKLAIDGGPAPGTALMYDKSLAAAKNAYYYFQPDVLKRIVRLLHNTGLQIAFHIVGDQGIDEALDAIEFAMKANRRRDPRHRIEHAIWVRPASLARIKKLGVVISTSPQWISWFGQGYRNLTDDASMTNFMPIATMLKQKIPVAFGCDVPASITHPPGYAFYGATTREGFETAYIPSSQECIDIHQALRIHTMGSAYAAFEEKRKGSIEVGKLADLVVWANDLYSATPEELTELEALMTIVGGNIVYEKE